MKPLFLFLLFAFSLFNLNSQTQGISYSAVGKGVATTFLSDYQCLGINSSALGWKPTYEGKKFTTGTSEFAFGIHSEALNADKLKNLYGSVKDKVFNRSTTIDAAKQTEAIANYAQAGVSISFDYNWFGFAYQGKLFGGLAVSINEHYQYYSKFNQQTTDLLFRGSSSQYFDSLKINMNGTTTTIANRPDINSDTLKNVDLGILSVPLNLSKITYGSEVKMVRNRTYNVGYGRKIIGIGDMIEIFGGIGGRYIQSLALFNLQSDDKGLKMFSAIPQSKTVNYGAIADINPSTFNSPKSLLPKSMGQGFGLDFSVSALFFKKLKVALAVNNIGRVTYDRNVYKVRDTLTQGISMSGISGFDVTQSIGKLISDGGMLQLQGQEKLVIGNASDIRLGGSFEPFKFLHFGFDFVAPLNRDNPGSIQNAVFSFGGDLRVLKVVTLSAGYFGGGVYSNNFPIGIKFSTFGGSYEFGISSRDAISFFTKNKNGISAAFGFARYRF